MSLVQLQSSYSNQKVNSTCRSTMQIYVFSRPLPRIFYISLSFFLLNLPFSISRRFFFSPVPYFQCFLYSIFRAVIEATLINVVQCVFIMFSLLWCCNSSKYLFIEIPYSRKPSLNMYAASRSVLLQNTQNNLHKKQKTG